MAMKVKDYGLLDYWALDEKVGEPRFDLSPFPCPNCGDDDFPETVAMLMRRRERNSCFAVSWGRRFLSSVETDPTVSSVPKRHRRNTTEGWKRFRRVGKGKGHLLGRLRPVGIG